MFRPPVEEIAARMTEPDFAGKWGPKTVAQLIAYIVALEAMVNHSWAMTRDEIAKDILSSVEKAADIVEIFDAVTLGLKRMWDGGYAAGMERAAEYIESGFYDRSPLAKAIRTLKDGGEPCEHCGYPLPQHESSCVRWHIQEPQ